MQIKLNSNMPRNTSIPVFKASNAYKICSKDYIHEKIQFLIIVSAEYGYEKKFEQKQ